MDIDVVPVDECDHQYPSAGTGRPKSSGTWSRSATVYVANQDNEGSGGDRLGNHPGSAGTSPCQLLVNLCCICAGGCTG